MATEGYADHQRAPQKRGALESPATLKHLQHLQNVRLQTPVKLYSTEGKVLASFVVFSIKLSHSVSLFQLNVI